MKRLFCYLLVIIASIGGYIRVYNYYIPNKALSAFEQKKDSLHLRIKKQITDAWNNDDAILSFKEHGGAEYLRMDMDIIKKIDSRKAENKSPYSLAWDVLPLGRYGNSVRWTFDYLKPGCFNDIYELYYINNLPWSATFIGKDEDSYNIKVISLAPIFVGYKNETKSLREYRPSLDAVCKDAKEYLQKEDPDHRMYYSPQNEDRISKLFEIRNDYYYFEFENYLNTVNPETFRHQNFNFADFNFYNHDKKAFPSGRVSWIYNNFYKVYYYSTRIGTMHLTFNESKYNNDIESYISDKRYICNIVFIIILSLIVISIPILSFRKKSKCNTSPDFKINNESKQEENIIKKDVSEIYERVIKLSNPELFIKPYQPEKLEKANKIYSSALKNKEDLNTLEILLEEALKL